MTGHYINNPGNEIPENTILIVPHGVKDTSDYNVVIEPLLGNSKRDWFTDHFYYCLPLLIGNQYGFIVKSTRDFDATWNGDIFPNSTTIEFLDEQTYPQSITTHFGSGIITIQNNFTLRTPLNINLMTIQPPNMFIPGTVAMTGVIESDQLRRDFTFNLKITIPNFKVSVRKGDVLGAFIPIPRYFVDNFKLVHINEIFDKEIFINEVSDMQVLGKQRETEDKLKPHSAGRKYFHGKHADDTLYKDHQKRIIKTT